MSAKKGGPVTTYDEVAERVRQREARSTSQDEADREREWNQWTAKKKAEAASDLRQAQRQALRGLDLPLDALDLVQRGCASQTLALVALEQPADLLVLAGGVGSGKTVAAVTWVVRWVMDVENWQQGDVCQLLGRAMFLTAPALQRGPRFDVKWMTHVERANRLVIDDLGAEYADEKGSFVSLLDELINDRYARRRPTLITTNCDGSVFKQRYGARIADRIRERGRFESVGSKSLRGGGKK